MILGMYYGPVGYWRMFDPTYLLVVIGVLLSVLASWCVNSTFKKYSKVRSMSGMTGAMAAERILKSQGINDVVIQRVSGNLTDHYNPSNKTLNLSESTYGSTSVAAVGVAAHECGHAIQHAKGYAPLSIRTALVSVANFGSSISWFLIIIGIVIGGSGSSFLVKLGILCFSLAVLFQIVTLPVEFNASSRALKLLGNVGILTDSEVGQTRKVLTAAALTYVAAAAASILQLVRLIMLFGGRDRD